MSVHVDVEKAYNPELSIGIIAHVLVLVHCFMLFFELACLHFHYCTAICFQCIDTADDYEIINV